MGCGISTFDEPLDSDVNIDIDIDIVSVLIQIISMIHEIQKTRSYHINTDTIASILKGSAIEPWMKDLPYYGRMRTITYDGIRDIIEKGISMGYLNELCIIEHTKFLKPTRYGMAFLEFSIESSTSIRSSVELSRIC